MKYTTHLLPVICISLISFSIHAAEWPSWGKDSYRNMVSEEEGIVFDFNPGELNDDESIDLKSTQNVKWVAKLGSQAYGNVTIGEGKVLVGTNNESPRDSKKEGTGEWSCALMKKQDLLSGNWLFLNSVRESE